VDRIYVLDHGRVGDDAKHDKLPARSGACARLFAAQAAGHLEHAPA
jgi:ABC-type multidrug transport system fused ATPase/permease subunit